MSNGDSVATAFSSQNYELNYYDQLHAEKYRDEGQTFTDHCRVTAQKMGSDKIHSIRLFDLLHNRKFIPAGRVQAAMGATQREVSAFNCSVSQSIEDSMDSIMDALSKAAKILRLGTGIGYNFSKLRPEGAEIVKLRTKSSGPLSFMKIFDVMASTIASSGHRRGAQMGIMNCDHPDIEKFIDAKMQKDAYRQFNLSVGVSDEFMYAVYQDKEWPLVFNGTTYKVVKARDLWNKIMSNAYNSAEPGIIFLDALNKSNNLNYCEYLDATNPCAEQPLPPNGLCLLGSFNLTAYVTKEHMFDYSSYTKDINTVVEAYDNVFERSVYAIPEHKEEAISKRRMGIGITGISNAIELMASKYGTDDFCDWFDNIANIHRNQLYRASIDLAKKRGAFPLYSDKYLNSGFVKTLPLDIQENIYKHGIRNSHLISYAPCGTISQTAGNISSGVEPIFYHKVNRKVYMKDGLQEVTLHDYNVRVHNFKGKTLEECTIKDHISVGEIAQKYCDSAVSKTVNVASSCPYEEYKKIYEDAHKHNLKGITVYRPTQLRGAVITNADDVTCKDGKCEI